MIRVLAAGRDWSCPRDSRSVHWGAGKSVMVVDFVDRTGTWPSTREVVTTA